MSASQQFKPFRQTILPDSRGFKQDLRTAIQEARKAHNIYLDKLFILENLLEEADEEGMGCTSRATTTPRDADKSRSRKWKPVYPVDKDGLRIHRALPEDWQCPCGSLLYGSKSCPKCGRVPLDGIKRMDEPQFIKDSRDGRHWKTFAKRTSGGRC